MSEGAQEALAFMSAVARVRQVRDQVSSLQLNMWGPRMRTMRLSLLQLSHLLEDFCEIAAACAKACTDACEDL